MKNLDDGPDGLNDAAFDRALSGERRKRLTARERALPGLRAEADRRLAVIEACAEGDGAAIEVAASMLAQYIRPDVQPDWDKYPLGARRYDRLGFRRGRP